METEGAITCFKRSKERHGLQYTKYLGDGDSSAFTTVNKSGIYDKPVTKLECTGHVQKRIGKALMTIVSNNKSKKFVVDKDGNILPNASAPNKSWGEKLYTGIGGMNRLTTVAIKSIQGHYGAAVRGDSTVEDMSTAIWAIYHHRAGNHQSCPDWCASRTGDLAKANRHKLPAFVCNLIKPAFTRLSDSDLLEKCVHGGMQNANESFYHVIWKYCPKETFVGIVRLKLATATATISFNDGQLGLMKLFERSGISRGKYHLQFAHSADLGRMQKANKACEASTKSQRKAASMKTASNVDKAAYSAGDF